MKTNPYLLILLIVFCVSSLPAQVNRKKSKAPRKQSVTKVEKKRSKGLTISGGVLNGKAENLVKPEYPLAAKTANVRGTVKVMILIDEKGNVIESKAYSGHLLLRTNAVSAASKSTFTATTVGGNPVKVRGIIIYNYVLDGFNWLEIGNSLRSGRFLEMLPTGFDEEKQLYEQYQSSDYDDRIIIFRSLTASIENKLTDNPKNLWLFQVGMLLTDISANCCAENNLRKPISDLRVLLLHVPDKVSSVLIVKLEKIVWLSENPKSNTYDPLLGNKIYQQLTDIIEKLPMLGN